MNMTEDQFEVWLDTQDGESAFYEYLYDKYPSKGDEGIIWMMESGNYVEEFMDIMGVIYNETE